MALQAGQEGNKLELNLQNEEAKKLQEMKWLRIDRLCSAWSLSGRDNAEQFPG